MVCDSTSDSSEGDEGVSPDNDDHFYMEKAKEIALQSPDTDTKVCTYMYMCNVNTGIFNERGGALLCIHTIYRLELL